MSLIRKRCYSSVLRYADRAKSEVYAKLAEDDHDVTPIEDIDWQSSRHRRFHPHTLMGKGTSNQLTILPSEICNVVSKTTTTRKPQEIRKATARYYVGLQETGAHQPTKDPIDVDVHLNGVLLHSYSSIKNVLDELKRRVPDFAPERVLEVGFGPATGILALNESFPGLKTSRKDSVVIGHPAMKKQSKQLLKTQQDEETRVLQHLPGYNTLKYDLIIATHQLYRSDHHFPASVDDHTSHLLSLLAPEGVLVLVERGDPRGFESIARARQVMFRPEDHPNDVSKTPREWKTKLEHDDPVRLKILAPCPHHGKCPLQVGLNLRRKASNPGFFNWCKFSQAVQRPKFTQELKKGQYLATEWTEDGKGSGGKHLSGSGRPFGLSYETTTHSYLIVQRNKTNDQVLTPHDSWPRLLRTPMKRDKHVIMEVCSPDADVEQWTVTKGHDKQAYHDARKSTGGDLWALGAKTVQQRGGNRAQMQKSERIAEKRALKLGGQELKTGMDDAVGNDIVSSAYAPKNLPPPTYNQEDDDLESQFEQIGKEVMQSHRVRQQLKQENKTYKK